MKDRSLSGSLMYCRRVTTACQRLINVFFSCVVCHVFPADTPSVITNINILHHINNRNYLHCTLCHPWSNYSCWWVYGRRHKQEALLYIQGICYGGVCGYMLKSFHVFQCNKRPLLPNYIDVVKQTAGEIYITLQLWILNSFKRYFLALSCTQYLKITSIFGKTKFSFWFYSVVSVDFWQNIAYWRIHY